MDNDKYLSCERQLKKAPGKKSILQFQQWQLINMGIDIKNTVILRYLLDFEKVDSDLITRWYYNERLKSDSQSDCFIQVDNTGKIEPLGEINNVFRYTWLLHDKLLSDLPILSIKKRQLRNYIKQLESLELIKTIVIKGRYSYFRSVKESIKGLYDKSAPVINYSQNPESLQENTARACNKLQTKDSLIIDNLISVDNTVNICAASAAPKEPKIKLIERLRIGIDQYCDFMDNGKVQFGGKYFDALDWTAQLPPDHPARIMALELHRRGLI